MLNHGDDSAIPVPAVFMFVPGMPVVVNRTRTRASSSSTGPALLLWKLSPTRHFPDTRSRLIQYSTLDPRGILLTAETTRDFHFVGMPPGTILLMPMSIKVECKRKRPWQWHDFTRKGLPCTPAFVCTDYKV